LTNAQNAILELVMEHGFWEYYNPISGEGLGANDFSWTASLVIDLLVSGLMELWGT
jgi:hypothetical protein